MGGILRFLDDADGSVSSRRVASFQFILLWIVGVEAWCRALRDWRQVGDVESLLLGLTTLAMVAGLDQRLRRAAFLALAGLLAAVIGREFPAAGNHAYLELILCLFCAGLDPDDAYDRVLFLRCVRWMLCVILFYAGLQKLVHGQYFHGQYLAFSLATESFRPILAPLLDPTEFERLLRLQGDVGDGPYHVASPGLLLASNLVYSAEILLPVLLCLRRTRLLGTLGTFVLVAAIEAGAREVFFGLVFLHMACAMPPGDWNTRSRPYFVLALAGLLAARLGLGPDVVFY